MNWHYWGVVILFGILFAITRRVLGVDLWQATVLYALGIVAAIAISIIEPPASSR